MLDMLGRMGQWFTLRLANARKKPRRAPLPLMDHLESRELQAVAAAQGTLLVHPGLLPNTGRYVNVRFYGAIATNSSVTPSAFFVVTDEYRRVEPHGNVTLTPVAPKNGLHQYAFNFTIPLLAARSAGTSDGRHYNIFVGAKDPDNTDGRTVSVYVPKQLPKSLNATA